MDPIANVQQQVIVARRILETTDTAKNIERFVSPVIEDGELLAELVIAQNDWRIKGGFDPYGASHSASMLDANRPNSTETTPSNDGRFRHPADPETTPATGS